MNKDKYAGEVYVELTFWSNVCCRFPGLSYLHCLIASNAGTSSIEEECAETNH
jgi:hypothetical protein